MEDLDERESKIVQDFVRYFKHTWLEDRVYKVRWNHWLNMRRRTTNNAEGFHNSLRVFFEGTKIF